MSETATERKEFKDFCDNCVVRDQVRGAHGIMERLEDVDKKLDALHSDNLRLKAIMVGIGIAYTFFQVILPQLIKMGQAAATVR